jgi:predicted RNA binding protein YcfA (HicA-like mRNA interferase family)
MPKLPQVTGQEACRAFGAHGFELDRIRGSHHVLKKAGFPNALTVPVHGSKTLKRGTLRNLIRDASLTVDQFVNALDG